MRVALAAALLAVLPGLAPAASGGSQAPPPTTPTTAECSEGRVYDAERGGCVLIERSSLDDDGLYEAARELAHAGRIDDALAALLRMSDQSEGRVLTYRGFAARKSGDAAAAMTFYRAALAIDPANHAARSYMAQGMVEAGDIAGARAELREIRVRGGRGEWPEVSLRLAIEGGRGFSY